MNNKKIKKYFKIMKKIQSNLLKIKKIMRKKIKMVK